MPSPDHLFRQTVTYAAITGRDAWGKATLGSHSIAAARVQATRQFVRDYAGDSVQASYVVYTASTAITRQHRVWTPADNTASDTAARRILAIDEMTDGTGTIVFRRVWLD